MTTEELIDNLPEETVVNAEPIDAMEDKTGVAVEVPEKKKTTRKKKNAIQKAFELTKEIILMFLAAGFVQMPTQLRFTKVRDVKSPQRGNPNDAGLDFFVPENFNNGFQMKLKPGNEVNIPSGLKIDIPKGYALMQVNKSGISTKHGLEVGACLIDEGYQGEIHLHVYNRKQASTALVQPLESKIAVIKPGMKIMQAILVPVSYAEPIEVDESELFLRRVFSW